MFDKKFLKQIIDSVEKDKPTKNSRVLVVDSMNNFMRNFSTVNYLNPTGHHIGGLVGFLKSLGYAIKLFHPTRVILVFDGTGSTQNKKYLYPDYKGNRNTTNVVNWTIFSDKEEEKESMENQMERLIHYLRQLPVTLISIPKIEADDSIGHIVDHFEQKSDCKEVIIMSTDKDFYQLISEKTHVYSPSKKKTYYVKDVLEEFKVHPNNFLIYKTLLGDSSDNLPGIKGLGPKKIIKMFPLSDDKELSLEDMFQISSENTSSKNLMYSKIIGDKQQMMINYQLMNIRIPNVSSDDKISIESSINKDINVMNVGNFLLLHDHDGLENHLKGVQSWLTENFGYLLLK
jgi:5'-3' exonuclease